MGTTVTAALASGTIDAELRVAEGPESPLRTPPARPRLLEQMRETLRLRHHSRSTEQAYE